MSKLGDRLAVGVGADLAAHPVEAHAAESADGRRYSGFILLKNCLNNTVMCDNFCRTGWPIL